MGRWGGEGRGGGGGEGRDYGDDNGKDGNGGNGSWGGGGTTLLNNVLAMILGSLSPDTIVY